MATLARTVSNGPTQDNTAIGVKVTESALGDIQHFIIDALTSTVNITLTAPSNATSTGLEASRIAKASAGTLYTISGYNSLASTQYIHVFDSNTLPANGVVPAIVIVAFANSTFGYTGGIRGRAFSTGIVVCNSTTATTKTIGVANCLFDVQYA